MRGWQGWHTMRMHGMFMSINSGTWEGEAGESHQFDASLEYIVKPCLRKTKQYEKQKQRIQSSNINLCLVFNTQGALCAAPLIFIIPSACYLKLSEEPRTHADKIMACVMLPVGAVVMVVGFVMAIANPQDCTHGQEMFYCLTSPDNISFPNISRSHLQLTTQPSLLNHSNLSVSWLL